MLWLICETEISQPSWERTLSDFSCFGCKPNRLQWICRKPQSFHSNTRCNAWCKAAPTTTCKENRRSRRFALSCYPTTSFCVTTAMFVSLYMRSVAARALITHRVQGDKSYSGYTWRHTIPSTPHPPPPPGLRRWRTSRGVRVSNGPTHSVTLETVCIGWHSANTNKRSWM